MRNSMQRLVNAIPIKDWVMPIISKDLNLSFWGFPKRFNGQTLTNIDCERTDNIVLTFSNNGEKEKVYLPKIIVEKEDEYDFFDYLLELSQGA